MAWDEVITTTLTAVQGSIAVLLVMVYGYGARAYGILSHKGERNVSTLVTTLLLPALLFTGIGPSIIASTIAKYWTILAYSVITQFVVYFYALLCLKLGIFESGLWIGACLFNNVISLPLLVLESLCSAGVLEGISQPNGEAAAQRARTYILVYALSSHLTSFIFGPKLMSQKLSGISVPSLPSSPVVEFHNEDQDSEAEEVHAFLVPGPEAGRRKRAHVIWEKLKKNMNPPLFGGLMAVIVGVIPPLHSLFLNDKGIFRGSLTRSLEEIGKLYASLQMLVVGAQLYSSSRSGRQDGVYVSKAAITALFLLRFLLMPLFTISFIYGLRSWKPHILRGDPMFDFALMIVPVGPPAFHLAAVAELAKVSEEEKGTLSRALMLSYVVTPIISISISAALAVVEKEGVVYNGIQ